MTTADYLIKIEVAPSATIPTPQEGITFTERFVIPTLDACTQLVAAGKIVAGGTILGSMGFAFIARAESPQQLDQIVATLPIWPRSHTTVVPLGAFEHRAAAIRERLNSNKSAAQAAERAAPDGPARQEVGRATEELRLNAQLFGPELGSVIPDRLSDKETRPVSAAPSERQRQINQPSTAQRQSAVNM